MKPAKLVRPRAGLADAGTARPENDPLARYWAKRDFAITAEPRGEHLQNRQGALTFVIQKHAASRLHYDFRLELDGVLVSWALPKGPSFDPMDKRMAIHVEDHPLSYGSFEGTIPPKQYGAGEVIVWDRGSWEPVGDPREGMRVGKVLFKLHGEKLEGLWELVKIAKGGERQEPWILFKKRDEFARPKAEFDVVSALPDSVIAKPLRTVKSASATKSSKSKAARSEGLSGTAKAAGAVKAALPATLSPQLATLAAGVPAGDWIFEIKFDGYWLMSRIEKGKARLITRRGHDWSAKMPSLVQEIEQMGLTSGWLDGEIVVLGANGSPDFNALQNAFDRGRGAEQIVYFVFDAPFFEGHDLRTVPQRERRQLLKAFLDEKSSEHVRFSADFVADPASILSSACRLGLEGVIAKLADAPYVSRRSEAWLKLKCKLRQEFVVCGYTERSDNASQIGSLLLGVHAPDGTLVSAGSVETGWGAEDARDLKVKLEPLRVSKAPFAAGPAKPGRWSKRSADAERWVKPTLVAEVTFAEWTPDGQVRHASFLSLRTDKPAKAIVRELAKDLGDPSTTNAHAKPASRGIKVSHAERVIDPTTGLTKLDLVRYYESVTDFILPHLKGRPVSLVRGPQGVTGQLFF
ncbi:MAG: DNA ligase D, partial [Alcaligenaceae bacterium]